jgi:hypothetical protein
MNKLWMKRLGDYFSLILLAAFLCIYIVELQILDLSFFLIFGFALAIYDLVKK